MNFLIGITIGDGLILAFLMGILIAKLLTGG